VNRKSQNSKLVRIFSGFLRIAVKKDSVTRRGSYITRTISYEGTIPCYLCLNKVRNSEWDSGEHRRQCFFQNQRELLSYPKPYEAYCPECSEKLCLWPAKGHPFYCDECPYPQKERLKRSTGQNRLNCFLCDFDCCASCSNAERFQKRLNTTSLQERFDKSMSPDFSEEGVISKSSSKPTYPRDPPYNPFHCWSRYQNRIHLSINTIRGPGSQHTISNTARYRPTTTSLPRYWIQLHSKPFGTH